MKRLLSAVVLALAGVGTAACMHGPALAKASSTAPLSDVEVAAIQQACETVSFQYARYLDAADWQNLPSVFAEDGVWEVLGSKMPGRAAIRDYWKSRTADWPEGHGRLHQISNQVIEVIDRDHARGTSTVVVWFFDVRPGQNKSFAPSLIARNDDLFVRTAEGWKLAHRKISPVATLAN